MEFTKNDLKDGYLVEYKNGKKCLVATIIDEEDGLEHKVFIVLLSNNDYYIEDYLYDFNDDLTYENNIECDFKTDDFDIEKVYGYPNGFSDLMDTKTRELLWERKRNENTFTTFQELNFQELKKLFQ